MTSFLFHPVFSKGGVRDREVIAVLQAYTDASFTDTLTDVVSTVADLAAAFITCVLRSLTHSLNHSLTHSLNHSFAHSLNHLHTHSVIRNSHTKAMILRLH